MGTVVRFARPTIEKLPHPETVRTMDPAPGDDAHAFYARMLRLWTIGAERFCGIPWAIRVLENQIAYLKARQVYAINRKVVRQWKPLQQAPNIRARAVLRVAPRPSPRRRFKIDL